MNMGNFILDGDILKVEAKMENVDYFFGVQWKAAEKPYGETWVLKSYANKVTGKKDLSQEKIDHFLTPSMQNGIGIWRIFNSTMMVVLL